MRGTCSIFVFLQVFDHLCGCYIFKNFSILSWVWKSCRNNTVLAFVINDNNNSNNNNNNNNDDFGRRFKNSKNSSRYFRMTSNFPESITEIEFDSINQEVQETDRALMFQMWMYLLSLFKNIIQGLHMHKL